MDIYIFRQTSQFTVSPPTFDPVFSPQDSIEEVEYELWNTRSVFVSGYLPFLADLLPYQRLAEKYDADLHVFVAENHMIERPLTNEERIKAMKLSSAVEFSLVPRYVLQCRYCPNILGPNNKSWVCASCSHNNPAEKRRRYLLGKQRKATERGKNHEATNS